PPHVPCGGALASAPPPPRGGPGGGGGPRVSARRDSTAETTPTPDLANENGALLGAIGLTDEIRPEAAGVIAALRSLGVRSCALLTGDRQAAAWAAARAVGSLDFVGSELLPADKARFIEDQKRAGRMIAMVGDGVNDAPALAAANVGLALGGAGSDLAAEAGDLVLMGDPLAPLPALLRLARELVRTIRTAILLFAFGMNAVGILLGALGWLSPVGGALFHEAASLAVMLYSLRLLWFERWDSTRLGRSAGHCARCAEWCVVALSPTRAVHGLLQKRALLARLACAALAIFWLCSNFVSVAPDQRALVTRFGRYEATLEAGWHFRWPWPIERVRREAVDLVRAVSLGFRATGTVPPATDGAWRPPIEWQAEHAGRGVFPVPAESNLLTGDEVALELTAEAHYRIDDLRTYLLEQADPVETLRAAAESAVRQVVAGRSLEDILSTGRASVEAETLRLLRAQAAQLRLGLEVTAFCLLDVHPPTEVVAAYRDVANALEEREQWINIAQVEQARLLLTAAGEKAVERLNREAAFARGGEGEGAPFEWRLDDENWGELVTLREGATLISGEAAARLQGAQQAKLRQVAEAQGRRAHFLSLLAPSRAHPALTRSQLYWTALEQALAARPLTIIDPESAGRAHVWLTDPDRFTLPPFSRPATGERSEPPVEHSEK
ncbi:MAG: HAD-IC family P-type ATPase, partial [Planctomycetaceae bacterium]